MRKGRRLCRSENYPLLINPNIAVSTGAYAWADSGFDADELRKMKLYSINILEPIDKMN
jgi:hypothetical protein